jgi:hypothetical protein
VPIDSRTALLDLIATHSFKLGGFTFASGQKTSTAASIPSTPKADASPAWSSMTSSANRSPIRKR